MDFIALFHKLLTSTSKSSASTIKNYVSDLRNFTRWYEDSFNASFDPAALTPEVIQRFQADTTLAPASKERRLAAVKKFLQLLSQEGAQISNPFQHVEQIQQPSDPWKIKEFRHHLHAQKASPVTVKNYVLDIEAFQKWYTLTYGAVISIELVTHAAVAEYKDRLLHILHLSPASVNRKMSSLRKYFEFHRIHTKIASEPIVSEKSSQISLAELVDQEKDVTYSSIPPVRLLQKLTEPITLLEDHATSIIARKIRNQPKTVSSVTPPTRPEDIKNIPKAFFNPQGLATHNLTFSQKLLHHLRYSRPEWYKKYHRHPFTPKTHIGIFMLFSSAIAIYLYHSFYQNNAVEQTVLGSQQKNTRLLTFSGKLTTADHTIISQPQKVTFSIYPHETNSQSRMWQEVRTITPAEDGSFTISLGELSPLTDTMFSSGSNLYLGIAIGNSAELEPRQPLTNTPLSFDSQHVQGLQPITTEDAGTKNVLLALNSSGDLEIGGSSNPTFRATDGEFTLSGNSVMLQTNPGTDGDIIFSPDGNGSIDLQGPIKNTSELGLYPGSVHIQDTMVIDATGSAQTALRVTTSGTGDLFTADSFGSTHFAIKSSGNIGVGTDQPTASLDVRGSLAVSGITRFNNLNYSWPTVSGIKGSVLTQDGAGNLSWATPESIGSAFFSINNGAIHTRNTLQDLLIGGSSTDSARFAFINMASGTPTASFAGNLTFTGSRTIASTAFSPLTFGTNQTGVITFQNAGNVGIGLSEPSFKFDVKDIRESTVISRFYNASTGAAADGIAIRLGNNSATTPTTNTFLKLETDGLGVVGAISGNGAGGVTYATNGPADFAEYLKKDPQDTIEYGSLVCLASNGLVTACTEDGAVIGVASKHPTFVGGENLGNRSIAVGMVGQIRVKVSDENGEIKPGDPISASQLPGLGKKARTAQYIVGRALESSKSSTDGTVLVLVQPSWFDPELTLNATGQLPQTDITAVSQLNPLLDSTYNGYVVRRAGIVINRIGSFAQASIGSIYAGVIEAQELIISGTISAQKTITKQLSITSDNVFISGKHLREYIVDVVKTSSDLFSSTTGRPQVYGDTINTLMISPLAQDSEISLTLNDSQLTIRNGREATASAVAVIDNKGNITTEGDVTAQNASISGQLTSDNLQSRNASISGTLTADTIVAGTIEGLEDKVASVASRIMQQNQNTLGTQNSTASAEPETFAVSHLPTEFVNLATVSANFAMVHDSFLSMGTATLKEATVLDSFSIGAGFVFGTNSINTLGQDLEIQPLRQGSLSLMAGSLIIATDGTVTFNENATFAKNVSVQGTLAANILTPLPDQDLSIQLDTKQNGQSQSIRVQNGSKTPVFSINNGGDVVSSGSAYFAQDLVASGSALLSKLNIFSSPVEAVSDTEVTASGSAGLATLKLGRREVTVSTPSVTENSLIYITPIGNTNNQVLYLGRQVPGKSFTVGIAESARTDIPFNWMIVN